MKKKILVKVIPVVGFLVISFIYLTMRIRVVRKEYASEFFDHDKHCIIAFWHSREIMMPFCYFGKSIHVLVSQHVDGEMVSRLLRFFKFGTVRGSSTRGGSQAFREMIRTSRVSDIAITPDGPRGPARMAQMGVVELARMTGLPILPVTFSAFPRKNLKTWDRMLIPRLFSRGVYIWGRPVYIGRELSRDETEEKRKEVDKILNEITDEADSFYGAL